MDGKSFEKKAIPEPVNNCYYYFATVLKKHKMHKIM
jgi:hypothetical protein